MAPEVITGQKVVSKEADVWAMGITVFELITKNLPYKNYEKTKAMFAIIQQPALRLNNTFNKEIHQFIEMTLQKEPKLRIKVEEMFELQIMRQNVSKAYISDIIFSENTMNSFSLDSSEKELNQSSNSKSVYFSGQTIDKIGSMNTQKMLETVGSGLIGFGQDKELKKSEKMVPKDRAFFFADSNKHNKEQNFLAKSKKISQMEERQNLSSSSLLKIKRAIRKVEKMKPGLTQKVTEFSKQFE
jgi:serine/threonine protein kinase